MLQNRLDVFRGKANLLTGKTACPLPWRVLRPLDDFDQQGDDLFQGRKDHRRFHFPSALKTVRSIRQREIDKLTAHLFPCEPSLLKEPGKGRTDVLQLQQLLQLFRRHARFAVLGQTDDCFGEGAPLAEANLAETPQSVLVELGGADERVITCIAVVAGVVTMLF